MGVEIAEEEVVEIACYWFRKSRIIIADSCFKYEYIFILVYVEGIGLNCIVIDFFLL